MQVNNELTVLNEIIWGLTSREGFILTSQLAGVDDSSIQVSLGLSAQRFQAISGKLRRKILHPSRAVLLQQIQAQTEWNEIATQFELDFLKSDHLLMRTEKKLEEHTKLSPGLIKQLKDMPEVDFSRLDPILFEHLIAELFAGNGFKDVKWVGRNTSTSADIFMTTDTHRHLGPVTVYVEVKREKEKIGISVINETFGAVALESPRPGLANGVTFSMVVSVSGFANFSKISQQELQARHMYLKGPEDIKDLLSNYDVRDTLLVPGRYTEH